MLIIFLVCSIISALVIKLIAHFIFSYLCSLLILQWSKILRQALIH